MSSIKMKKQGARSALQNYSGHQRELSNAIGIVRGVKSCRCMSGRNFSAVYKALDRVIGRLEDEKKDIKKLEDCLSDILRTYETYENSISGEIKEKKAEETNVPNWEDIIKKIKFPILGLMPPLIYGPLPNTKLFNVGEFRVDSLTLNTRLKDTEKAAKKALSGFVDSHSEKIGVKSIYDTARKTWTKIDPNDKDAVKKFNDDMPKKKLKHQFTLAHVGDSAAVSLLNGAVAGDWGWGSASAKAEVGKGEAYAKGDIGLGNIQGSLGASFTAFTAEEILELGNNSLGAYVGSTQTVGRVGAKAEGRAGLLNDKGELDPALYIGASAEAIAGEITGKAGVKVLGADVGVKGSLNYGIGAHANVGFRDGKLSVDIGATLGVGGSVSMDIDVAGFVNGVKDKAKAAWNQVTNLLKW